MQRKQTQKNISAESGGDSLKGQPAAVSRNKYMAGTDLEILAQWKACQKKLCKHILLLGEFSKYTVMKHIWKGKM